MTGVKTLIGDLVVGESPRWHGGHLWFCNWGAQEIRTVDLNGNSEVVAKGPKPIGYCIDFLPDGRLLVTGEDRLLRRESDGSFVTHADLWALGKGWNEVTVDQRSNIYVYDDVFRLQQEDVRPRTIQLRAHVGDAYHDV